MTERNKSITITILLVVLGYLSIVLSFVVPRLFL